MPRVVDEDGDEVIADMESMTELLALNKELCERINALPSADRPKDGDLISRVDAIEALGEEPPVWCDEEYEIAERSQWRDDIEAIKSVPSADRPRGEWINTAPPNRSDNIVCDKCGYDSIARYDFCPNCGAEMRGEDE